MSRRIYSHPPIVEAVIELRFDGETDAEALATQLGSALAEQYRGERQHQQRVEAVVDPKEGKTTTRLLPGIFFLRSADQLRLLGCGRASLSTHVLAPYPGWESFLEQTRDAVGALARAAERRRVTAVLVRYIDRFVFPVPDVKWEEFLTIRPLAPPDGAWRLTGFHSATEATDSSTGARVVLTLASTPSPQAERPAVLYDLLLERPVDCGVDGPEWVDAAESLHVRQREIFESSITDRMRELFG